MIHLRSETTNDQPQIYDVVKKAFGKIKEAELVNLIRDRGRSRIATVAHDDSSIVGYLLASPIAFEPANALNCLAIGPVAVVPERQGEQIGSKLMHHTIQIASEQQVDAIFLLGHTSYYPRFGFTPTHISNEYGATDAFMALELRVGCLNGVSGTAQYVSEFAEVGA